MVNRIFRRYLYVGILVWCTLLPLKICAQSNTTRSLISLKGKVQTIDLASQNLFQPTLMDAQSGNVVIYDYKQHCLLTFIDGKFRTVASGLGGGPEEFRNPTDLVIDEQQNIWVADPQQARISVWNRKGKLIHSISHQNELPAKLAVSREKYVVKKTEITKDAFVIHSTKDSVTKTFGDDIVHDLGKFWLLTGGYTTSSGNGFYFAPLYTGFLYKYDLSGHKIFVRKTIDFVSLKRLKESHPDLPGTDNVTVHRAPRNAKHATSDIDSDGIFIYLLYTGNFTGKSKFIDIYNQNGKYFKSIKVKYGTVSMAIDNHTLYRIVYNQESQHYMLSIQTLPSDV